MGSSASLTWEKFCDYLDNNGLEDMKRWRHVESQYEWLVLSASRDLKSCCFIIITFYEMSGK